MTANQNNGESGLIEKRSGSEHPPILRPALTELLRSTTVGCDGKSINAALRCPLTHSVMTDPVIDPEGNTYERQAIEEWLDKHGSSPQTRATMNKSTLVPNRALREIIAERMGKSKSKIVCASHSRSFTNDILIPLHRGQLRR